MRYRAAHGYEFYDVFAPDDGHLLASDVPGLQIATEPGKWLGRALRGEFVRREYGFGRYPAPLE